MPAVAQPADDRGVVRRHASPRGSATRRWSARPAWSRTSLTASGTPASGPSCSPAARRGVDRGAPRRARRRRRRAGRRARAPSTAAIRSRWAWVDLDGGRPRRRRRPRPSSAAVQPGQVGRRRPLTSSSRIRGTRKRLGSAAGAPASASLAGQARARLRPARKTLVSGSGCDVGGMSSAATSPTWATAEDHVELAGEPVELVVGRASMPGEPGEVRDLVAGDRRHADMGSSEVGRGRRSSARPGASGARAAPAARGLAGPAPAGRARRARPATRSPASAGIGRAT